MIYFVATFVVFLLVIVAMAIGYIFNKQTIGGSCGGLSSIGIEKSCDCDDPCENRKKKNAEAERISRFNSEGQIL
jgi:hypothetical protein